MELTQAPHRVDATQANGMATVRGERRPNPWRQILASLALTAAAAAAHAQIGMSQLQVDGLPVTLVYPTVQATQARSIGPIELQMAPDATPSPGLRQLIVLSHGSGASPDVDHTLATTLVRAGYVVAQPLHAGDNFQDRSRPGYGSWVSRTIEVTRVIDGLARHPTWQPLLRLDRVGVHGMSAGGATALSLAGAQWRPLDLVRHCLAHTEADFGFASPACPPPTSRPSAGPHSKAPGTSPRPTCPPT